ncbi:MAG: ComEA family DNA-binding protein [Gemmatimonadota bacterium]
MDPRERRALALIVLLAIIGHGIRAARGAPKQTAVRLEAVGVPPSGDPLGQLALAESLARPLGPRERIDVDRATVRELQRLPGVGPALAERIVADRQSAGAFGGTRGLARVRGIGPATLERLTPHLTFTGTPADAGQSGQPSRISLNRASQRELEQLPGIGAVRAAAIIAFRDSAGPFRQTEQLYRVPGLPRQVVERLSGLVRID